jgi:hypothetical protein
MNQTIITNAGYNAIANALASSTQITPKYFKVSYNTDTPDPSWTDIPSPVLTKPISGFIKVNSQEFRLYCNILETEVSNNIGLVGIYDNNDTLLFVTKLDPPIPVNSNLYLETRYILNNYESVINFNEIPYDEYEQTNILLDILTKYHQLVQDHTCYEISLRDLQATVTSLQECEAFNINEAINNHNLNEGAHPPLQQAMAKAGIFVNPTDVQYVGQFWDEFATFDVLVTDDMVVYKDTDGVYKPALADGTIRASIVGIAKIAYNRVIASGFIDISHQPNVSSFNIGDKLYLSDAQPGIIINDETAVQIGYYLGNNIALIGVGVGGGKGEVTFEDLTYVLLLHSNPYKQVYYDKLDKSDTLYIISGSADFISKDSMWKTTSSNTTFETVNNIIDGTDTYYRFLVHVESSDVVNVEYSIDNGSTWNSLTLDETVVVSSGFNRLRLRFNIPNNNTEFYSFGVLYEYTYDAYTPDTRMFEIVNIDSDQNAPVDIVLPNGATYTTSGKDLEVYLNRLRLVPGIDYEEIDSRTVRILINLKKDDVLVFTEKWGYVDNSVENQNKLNALAPSWTDNYADYIVLRDQSDGTPYKVFIQGGSIQIQPL